MNYDVIDKNTWERKDLFEFYTTKTKIVLNLTVDIDVTPLIKFAKNNNLKFYPCMMWVVCKIINSHKEFRYNYKDGNLINWHYLSPAYVDFHTDDQNFTKLTTEYCDDIFEFNRRFEIVRKDNALVRGFKNKMPENFFDVSCLPWTKYKSFDLHIYDEGTCLNPIVVWGKYEYKDSVATMPLTMNIHHAVCDGFHLCRFFNEVQDLISNIK